jgi:hypothetical protein
MRRDPSLRRAEEGDEFGDAALLFQKQDVSMGCGNTSTGRTG